MELGVSVGFHCELGDVSLLLLKKLLSLGSGEEIHLSGVRNLTWCQLSCNKSSL